MNATRCWNSVWALRILIEASSFLMPLSIRERKRHNGLICPASRMCRLGEYDIVSRNISRLPKGIIFTSSAALRVARHVEPLNPIIEMRRTPATRAPFASSSGYMPQPARMVIVSGGEVGIMFLSGSWGEVAEGNVVQHHRVLNQSAAKHEEVPYRVHVLYVLHRVENYSDRV